MAHFEPGVSDISHRVTSSSPASKLAVWRRVRFLVHAKRKVEELVGPRRRQKYHIGTEQLATARINSMTTRHRQL